MNAHPVLEIADHFLISGKARQATKVGVGHIHASYAVATDSGRKYFLQKINHHVFQDVDRLMQNLALVSAHLKGKADYQYQSLTPIKTKSGELYFPLQGSFWRMFEYLDDLASADQPKNTEQVKQAAIGIADFLGALADLPCDKLNITIPKFHHIDIRYEQLAMAQKKHTAWTENEMQVMQQIDTYYPVVYPLFSGYVQGTLTSRITHNDTKFNNLMFDAKGRVGCIVDLDTVMPGSLLFDMGDALRTIAALGAEDEVDLTKVGVNLSYYAAFKSAFLDQLRAILTYDELQLSNLAAAYMALIMSIRFMTDHLNGDIYFGANYRGHNLDRAANQAKMASNFLIVEKIT